MTQSRQHPGCWSIWGGAMLLVLWVLLSAGGAAEAPSPHYRVAVLTPGGPINAALEGFQEGLAQLGYQAGKDITIMVEDVQGDVGSLAGRAAKLVAAKPDVIFTIATAPTVVARQATTTLPIVFAVVADPLRSGLIASYASSQNNVTGITNSAGPLSGKRLEVLQEIAPGIKRVLTLVAPQEKVALVSFQFLAEAAPKLGIELLRHDVSSQEEIAQTLQAVPRGAVDAIYHVPSSLVGTHIDLLIRKAMEDKIPLAAHDYTMVERGALLSYGADFRLIGMQAAPLVVKILRGARPEEIPIQAPERLLLDINLSTARAIGLHIPPDVLERAERLVD